MAQNPGAFVTTDVQIALPFDQLDWQGLTPRFRDTPGLLSKTWLAGVGTNGVGALYAFDTVENARRFVLEDVPALARELGVPFSVRLWDAGPTVAASKALASPFFGD